MDVVVATILACSVHADHEFVQALTMATSDGHRFYVADLSAFTGNDSANSREAAERLVEEVERRNHRAGLGLLAVPGEWAAAHGRAPGDLWDACVNTQIATSKLAQFSRECRLVALRSTRADRVASTASSPRAAANRACIVRKYAQALGVQPTLVSVVIEDVRARLARMRPRPSHKSRQR